jgi:hypothetical protein
MLMPRTRVAVSAQPNVATLSVATTAILTKVRRGLVPKTMRRACDTSA